VTRMKRVGVTVEQDGFGAFVHYTASGWELDVWHGSKILFSAAGETRESVLRALDDFIAGLIEVSRLVESVAKKVEDMAESFAKE